MAEITEVQDELVSFTMFTAAAAQPLPSLDGGPEPKLQTHFPLQLYCRARPWLQVRAQRGASGARVFVRVRAHVLESVCTIALTGLLLLWLPVHGCVATCV